jgi:chromosome segregation ATPase
VDDASKKEYCDAQFDLSDDKKKAVERSLSDEKAAIAKTEEGIATTQDEIAALQAGIKALDQAVAEATEQRKEENLEYNDLMASNAAAKDILAFAKNRLNKFYNPKLYKPPAKVELSKDDRIVANMGGASFVQISEHRGVAAPPPPPATAAAYTKKSGESGGVIAMIDLLVKDLTKEMTVAKTEEQDAQSDYEVTMKDSAEKRAQDSKSLTDKDGAKADLEADLEAHKAAKTSATKELGATLQYIASLHAECDWLLQYFDVRQEARTGEIDSLVKAKAVLSGADFSLVQIKSLRGSA